MNDVVSFGNGNLPSVQSLTTALRSLESEVGAAGMVILKMDKTGHWVFGADQTEIDDDSTWAINPFSFVHGFIAWGEGEVLGEKMVPVSEPLPEMDTPPPGAKRGWEMQVGMSLKCMNGDDKGMEARYNVTSVGGKRAVQKLALEIAAQVENQRLHALLFQLAQGVLKILRRLLAKRLSFEPDLRQRELSKLRCQLPHMLGCHHHLHHMHSWKDCRVRGMC